MTWNGDTINSNIPTLIYHDELYNGTGPIDNPNGPGRLVCTSQTPRTTHWTFPTYASRIVAGNTDDNFFHRREGTNPVVSRLSLNSANPITTPRTDYRANGLWRCNEDSGPTIYVAIYARVPGAVAIV